MSEIYNELCRHANLVQLHLEEQYPDGLIPMQDVLKIINLYLNGIKEISEKLK